ncbi:CHAT domain-containing protein [Lactarius hatsudake]|nr:CHAT domain-containing protein [Lactarius hatsudake]
MAAPEPSREFTLPQVEYKISETLRLLSSSTQLDPHRPARLRRLAQLHSMRDKILQQRDILDKIITRLTKHVLFLFQRKDVVSGLFHLAYNLYVRFSRYEQPEDLKSSLKYCRYLRDNFHPLDAFDISYVQFASLLVQMLADNLKFGSGDIIHDMEEMVALIPAVLASEAVASTHESKGAISAFTAAVKETEIFRRRDAQQVADRVIRMLRKATVLKPDLPVRVSFALAWCLDARFQTTYVIEDYEEAIAIADKIVAAITPGDAQTRDDVVWLILYLVVARLNSSVNPEYLEDTIHRLRVLLRLPSLSDEDSALIAGLLNMYIWQRSHYFGVTGNSRGIPLKNADVWRAVLLPESETLRQRHGNSDNNSRYRTAENSRLLNNILFAISNEQITDVDVVIERARTLLPPPNSNLLFSWFPSIVFANILREGYIRTKKPDYFNEAITAYRDLRKASAPKGIHFEAGRGLYNTLLRGADWLGLTQHHDEAMQLAQKLANDESGEVFRRFGISHSWAYHARLFAHSSISTAYETTISLMQETLIFTPTLHTQHFRLINMPRESERLPSDYASYQIETDLLKSAVETLERGRALLWSELRGLRTSTDQLHAADPALADKFAAINRKLESVTMSVAQSKSNEMDNSETETGDREGMDPIGSLVITQRKLLDERNLLISHIQSLPGLKSFLRHPSFDVLNSAAARGPVIVINQSEWRSDIVILHKDLPPSVISTPSDFYARANGLKDQLLRVRKEKGLESEDYGHNLASVLADLYELVGKPVIERLRQLEIPEKSRIWWCPTSAFCSLPLHAMGPIPSDDSDGLYFMDLYISSYTPTLSALIESRKSRSQPIMPDKPSLLLVAQPETLHGAWGEIDVVQAVGSSVTTLISATATPETVVEGLKGHRFAHFVCHGLLEIGKPFDASFELRGDNLTLLKIVRSQLPAAEFAFLSACHTAELTEDSIADEGLHLAAAMQFCGFRSVVGTMWAMADTDGADLAKHFYKSIFSESSGRRRVPYYERSARALQFAVKKLRNKRGITLERWTNFVHYGA